jgi:hypothetical protein
MNNFNEMKPKLTGNIVYMPEFTKGYDLAMVDIKLNGFNSALNNFNNTYPVGVSGYFKTLSDYFYAKGQCACLLDNNTK